MISTKINPSVADGVYFDSYELPLKDYTSIPDKNGGGDGDCSPTSHRPTLPSCSSLKRRRLGSSCSSTSMSSSSSSSCGIHLSSLSLSSMSSNDTYHGRNDSESGVDGISSLYRESFLIGSDHVNSSHNFHCYPTPTDDECDDNGDSTDVSAYRLSKRHRAYTDLSALSSSPSFTMMDNTVDRCCESGVSSNNSYCSLDDNSDSGWGYYVDTV